MTSEKLRGAFASARAIIQAKLAGTPLPKDAERIEAVKTLSYTDFCKGDQFRHALFMCDEAIKFIDEGRIEKACRWLGFVQGVMWTCGFASINELKDTNRGWLKPEDLQ